MDALGGRPQRSGTSTLAGEVTRAWLRLLGPRADVGRWRGAADIPGGGPLGCDTASIPHGALPRPVAFGIALGSGGAQGDNA